MNLPWLSVIMPTYNGETYLNRALDSIVSQQDPDIECLVIDDGSSDRTLAILESYADQLSLKIIQKKRVGNWVTNTNEVLLLAKGDRVCFLHQDDLWLPSRLAMIKQLVQDYPQANLILHAVQFINPKDQKLGRWSCPLPSLPRVVSSAQMVERLLIQNFIAIPAPVFLRETALKVGGLDEKLWYTADWDFWLKIAFQGDTLYYPQPLAAFRVHAHSQTILRSVSLADFSQQLETVLLKHWKQWSAPLGHKDRIWKIAHFSINVNTALAGKIHGQKINHWQLLYGFLSLGIVGWYQYLRGSRIWERVSARLRAKLQT